jgi:muramoyltetrapeptide carboxypeptidase
LAGDDYSRARDLEKMWLDETIAAIWCLRGGYGSLRLLKRLNYDWIAENPKVLIGFSDITALELALWSRLKLVTFHGPVLTQLQSNFSRAAAWKMISGELKPGARFEPSTKNNPLVLRNGRAEGMLLGGNLTTINSMLGTGYLPDFRDTIIFIEEVGEAAYRIDRMLTQLTMCGIFEDVKGIMIGECIPVEGESETDIIRVFEDKCLDWKCPVGYAFPIGHLSEQWMVPQGIRVGVDFDLGETILLETTFNRME